MLGSGKSQRHISSYSEDYLCHTASDRELGSLGEYTEFVLSMLSMFPDARMTIDHLYWNDNGGDGYRVAVRWSLVGTHSGPGVYGGPTGKRVHNMGISHHHVQDGKFVAEWTVFDEIALMKQLHTPDVIAHAPDVDKISPPDMSVNTPDAIANAPAVDRENSPDTSVHTPDIEGEHLQDASEQD